MGRIFTTTDTHGCVIKLKDVLAKANFDYQNDTLIHLGDCVDRGPDSKGVIDLLLSINNLIAIRGNHDDWLLNYIKYGIHGSQWTQGADLTLRSYIDEIDNTIRIPEKHKAFFKNQVNYYVDNQNRLFVHAGFNPETLIEHQDNYMLFWDRDLVHRAKTCLLDRLPDVNDFKRIFIGHTPTQTLTQKDVPMYAVQVVDLDTAVAYGGKITLIDITDDKNHIIYQI